ncbi:hypothetical protein L208DRAFT_1426222 [Tricholoma matsutake]|nr:hypothetical protein L208DRAFT_1426222 [Tricholoma matsutake 945]
MKRNIAIWLNSRSSTTMHLNPEDCKDRGLQNDVMGRLLCPINFDWDDPDVHAKVRACDEDFNPSISFYYCCFYPNGYGDPDDVEQGFLRSSLLVKTFSAIFLSPSSASGITDDGNKNIPPTVRHREWSKATKANVAQKLYLDKVMLHTIAYAAVMLHFSLTDVVSWKEEYNGLSYELLYNFVVDYLEDLSCPIAVQNVHELLKGWNK